MLLPYLGRGELYARYHFDEPWDGPNNLNLIGACPDEYQCPADASSRDNGEANYYFVTGKNAVFEAGRSVRLNSLGADVHFTVLLVEACRTGIKWSEPRDLDLTTLDASIGAPKGNNVSSMHGGGAFAVTADAQRHYLKSQPQQTDLRLLFQPDSQEKQALLSRLGIY